MKRSSWRWYLAWGIMVASLSMLFFMMTAGPAQAYTQLWNTYNWDPNTHQFVGDPNCGNTTAQPCLYWQEPHNTSINLYFYMDPSLSTGAGGYDYFGAVLQAFTQYNQVADWGPYMIRWVSGDPTFGGSYSMGMLPCNTLGSTTNSWNSNIEYGYNPKRGGNEYYSFFTNAAVTFNNGVQWNNSLDWTFNSCSDYHADGLENAVHESGHVQGLGHTGHRAIMYPVASYATTPFETLQSDDIQGLQDIYPGNQQSS